MLSIAVLAIGTLFTETIFRVLVVGSLIWTALGFLVLVGLLLDDKKKGRIW